MVCFDSFTSTSEQVTGHSETPCHVSITALQRDAPAGLRARALLPGERVCNSTLGCAAFVSWPSVGTPGTPLRCQLKRIDGPGTGGAARGTYLRVQD